ncbi:hypothetical protein EYF80_056860 [Liparis tanakae]|uniref:Uncharacterized protein n=1 Tax=Liparis tanakae TaxID=230148 RepID=A0A4Z2EVK5_9TELE|nr:hypothetical protein EYF80_056860 [Liparis tanakae]
MVSGLTAVPCRPPWSQALPPSHPRPSSRHKEATRHAAYQTLHRRRLTALRVEPVDEVDSGSNEASAPPFSAAAPRSHD